MGLSECLSKAGLFKALVLAAGNKGMVL